MCNLLFATITTGYVILYYIMLYYIILYYIILYYVTLYYIIFGQSKIQNHNCELNEVQRRHIPEVCRLLGSVKVIVGVVHCVLPRRVKSALSFQNCYNG